MQQPLGVSWGYGYDENSNLTSVRDALGQTTTTIYDAAGRLDEARLEGGAVAKHTWRGTGQLEGVTYGAGLSRTMTYDTANRIKTVTNQIGAQKQSFEYDYDPSSNRTREVRSEGDEVRRTIDYVYDEVNRLKTASYGGGWIEICGKSSPRPVSRRSGRSSNTSSGEHRREQSRSTSERLLEVCEMGKGTIRP